MRLLLPQELQSRPRTTGPGRRVLADRLEVSCATRATSGRAALPVLRRARPPPAAKTVYLLFFSSSTAFDATWSCSGASRTRWTSWDRTWPGGWSVSRCPASSGRRWAGAGRAGRPGERRPRCRADLSLSTRGSPADTGLRPGRRGGPGGRRHPTAPSRRPAGLAAPDRRPRAAPARRPGRRRRAPGRADAVAVSRPRRRGGRCGDQQRPGREAPGDGKAVHLVGDGMRSPRSDNDASSGSPSQPPCRAARRSPARRRDRRPRQRNGTFVNGNG